MRFLHPSFFHLLWLALIPLALYLFRKKAIRVPVSTLLFFRSLSREHQESAWLRRLKKWISLLLTLLVLAFAILALAHPSTEAANESPGAVVLVVDRSASMAAQDASGKTRLEVAKAELKDRLRGLPDQVIVSLVAFDSKPRVLLSRSRNRRECLRLIEELSPTPTESHTDSAWTVVRRMADLEAQSQIWHVGDTRFASASDQQDRYAFLNVALPAPVNVGITGFQIRQAPLSRDRYEVFTRVTASAGNAEKITATLEVTLAGRIAQLRELDLSPGQSTSLLLPLDGVRGQLLELKLKAPGDCLGWDNAVASPLPQVRPLLVHYIADPADPFVELALASFIEAGRIEMLKGTPSTWPPQDKPDVYVFDHWLPDSWPEDRPVIALNPPASAGPIRLRPLAAGGLPHDSVRTVTPDHPILFRVSSSRLAVTQTSVLELSQSLEPLWMAGNEPVLEAGEVNGQRLVVAAFSPSRSEQLALLPAFPLMLGNALYWAGENSEALADLKTQRPGQLLHESGLIQWTAWDGEQFIQTSDEAGGLYQINRIGAWQTTAGRGGASILASAAETNLPALTESSPSARSIQGTYKAAFSLGDWPQLFMVAILGLLLLESFLFHRKAVF